MKIKFVSILFLPLLMLSFSGCSLSSVSSSDRPSIIPVPSTAAESLPDVTEEETIETIPDSSIPNFIPIMASKPYLSWVQLDDYTTEGIYQTLAFDNTVSNDFISLLADTVIITAPVSGAFTDLFGSTHYVTFTNPLISKPVKLVRKRRYKKLFQATVAYPATYEKSYTVSSGSTATEAQEFTETMGLSVTASAGGDWGVFSADISATLSDELSTTFSSSVSLSSSEEVTQTFTCPVPDNGETILFAEWQEVEIFEFVDSDGNIWTGPEGFPFLQSFRMINNKSDNLVMTVDRF